MILRRSAYGRRVWMAVAWLVALFLFAAAYLGTSTRAWADTADVTMTVKQEYTSDSASAQSEFTYVMEATTAGAPLPGGATGAYTWTMTGDDEETLTISYDPGLSTTYEYSLYQQKVDPAVGGFTYDTTKYTAQLMPLGSGGGALLVFDEKGETKISEPTWSVTYVSPSYYEQSGDTVWVQGSDESLDFTFKRNYNDDVAFEHFTGIRVDDAVVAPTYYTAKEGSVIVTLKATYLATLATGDHTIEVLFDDGDPASASFKVTSKQDDPDNGGGNSNGNGGSNGSNGSSNNGARSGTTNTPVASTGDTMMSVWPLVALAGIGLVCAVVALRMRANGGSKRK